jgi:hypothetical protein
MKKFLIILGFVPLFQSCVSMQPSGDMEVQIAEIVVAINIRLKHQHPKGQIRVSESIMFV